MLISGSCTGSDSMKNTKKDRFKLCVLAIVTIAAEVVTLLTFGGFNTEWRAKLLFSDWMEG